MLPPALKLYPYQQRWIDDPSRFLLAVKSARIGFSYATGLRAIFKCLERPNYTRTVLSASKSQSVEFVETCKKNLQLMGAVAQASSEPYADELGATDIMVEKILFPNGSRIMALPANPRTARGYPGDITLDEFAHHQDSYAIWAAAIRQTALGNGLEALSTPNGRQGKFYDLAVELGMEEGCPDVMPVRKGPWSGHWIDVYSAVRQGCPINIEEMKAGVGDADTWAQEFECRFLEAAGAWLSLELVSKAEDTGTSTELPAGFRPRGALYGGIDVGRSGDRTCMWIDEMIGDVAWTRMVLYLQNETIPQQARVLAPYVAICDRTAMDSTGLGIGLFDLLNEKFQGQIIGVNFGGSTQRDVPEHSSVEVAKSMKLKVKLAIDLKKQMEQARARIPHGNMQIRQELMSIKREPTATGVTFDAPRIEIGTAVAGGVKKKVTAHAEAFWAKALAVFAAQSSPLALGITTSPSSTTSYSSTGGFM